MARKEKEVLIQLILVGLWFLVVLVHQSCNFMNILELVNKCSTLLRDKVLIVWEERDQEIKKNLDYWIKNLEISIETHHSCYVHTHIHKIYRHIF